MKDNAIEKTSSMYWHTSYRLTSIKAVVKSAVYESKAIPTRLFRVVISVLKTDVLAELFLVTIWKNIKFSARLRFDARLWLPSEN